MRTTVDLADDVFFAAKDAARREKRSLGVVLSAWARQALAAPAAAPTLSAEPAEHPLAKFGIHPLPHRGAVVTNELIDQLRDDGPY